MSIETKVNEYIKTRTEIERLQKIEKIQRAEMLESFKEQDCSVLKGSGSNEVRKLIQRAFKIKPLLFARRVTQEALIKSCSISITKGADYLSRDELEAISTETERISLKIHV